MAKKQRAKAIKPAKADKKKESVAAKKPAPKKLVTKKPADKKVFKATTTRIFGVSESAAGKTTTAKTIFVEPQHELEPKKTIVVNIESAKTEVKNAFKDANPDQYFILCDGRSIRNLKELALMMDEIEDHIFSHHVTWDRHDFSRWVHDVFEEADLADEIRQATNRKDAQMIILKHLIRKI